MASRSMSDGRVKYFLERSSDGAIVVRVRSVDAAGSDEPELVFTFHRGQPQYERWAEQYEKNCPTRRTGQS